VDFPDRLTGVLFFYKTIIVAPKISPFSFGPDSIYIGDSVSIQCSVTVGDFPIQIKWFLNDEPIKLHDIVITKLGSKVLALTIDSVNVHHVGTYRCLSENKAGSYNYSSDLIVHGIILILIPLRNEEWKICSKKRKSDENWSEFGRIFRFYF
jgi:hypothetical protein